MSFALRTPKWTLLLAFLIYIALLSWNMGSGSAYDGVITAIDQALDKEAQDFIASIPTPKQHFATRLQRMLHCGTLQSNSTCNAYTPSLELVPNASSRICEHLAGKRIVFVGPLTTYHLHNLWLETLADYEGHSMDCPGPEFCIFHHICYPGRNASAYLDGRKQLFPKNKELQETRSAVLQYALSTALVSHPDKTHDIYTRPIVDPTTGIRMRNYFWLRKAQKASILVLSIAPISAPAWTYSRHFPREHNAYRSGIFSGLWGTSVLGQDLITQALNATFTSFLPSLRDAVHAVRGDAQIRKSLIIWHGHWPLAPGCTNLGLPKHVPRLQQFWTAERESVDPWTFYYNLQIYIQDKVLPKLLTHFNIVYVPLSIPPLAGMHLEPAQPRKDCIRQGRDPLEAAFFSALLHILELHNFSPASRSPNRSP